MKKRQHEASRIRKMLLKRKREGVTEVIWKLDSKAKKAEVERLGFPTEPWLFEIRTKPFKYLKDKPAIIKDIHYSYKKSKRTIVRRLNVKERDILREYGVSMRELKYKIRLI